MVGIRKYRDSRGRVPFDDWIRKLRDTRARQQILIGVRRLSLGLEGDWKTVSGRVRELRIPTGKGYRVYYAWLGRTEIILLCGGDKTTQPRDIDAAIRNWRDYDGPA